MTVSPARAAAFDILLRVETTNAYASELLHSSRLNALSPADHGLATEIVMGVLRWRSVLDEQIAAHIPQPIAKLDAEVIAALRIGAYQLLFLDRIPAHAAINDSVELVKKARKRSAAGMVNAVLRKINPASAKAGVDSGRAFSKNKTQALSSRAQPRDLLSTGPQQPSSGTADAAFSETDKSDPSESTPRRQSDNRSPFDSLPPVAQDDSVLAAHPNWLVAKWTQLYGAGAARKICTYDQQPPRTAIRADAALAEELVQEGIELEPGRLLSSARVVVQGDVTRSKAFRERRLAIQDEGSQLVALLLGHGQRILDCCAAPGGKTRIIAEQNPHARVLALDLHPHRAALLQRLVSLPNVDVVAADARRIPFAAHFDRILLDAPCTGTGTLARNPEIKWRLNPNDVARLQAYQLEILKSSMQHLSPGGQLLYSTCSLEPEENELVIEQALLAGPGFRVSNLRDRLTALRDDGVLAWEDMDSLISGPYLRTIPGLHPCDGFFAALLERE